ncbi:MAG: nucleotidyl transferase AbiEii/AbiGii toxin family protein [Akkermansia sp.]
MNSSSVKNIVASTKAKLSNIAKQHGWDYQHILTRYATERFLYRLSISPYREQFILKGGNLFIIWMNGINARPTIDTDLLRHGDASPEKLEQIFFELASAAPQESDGVVYDPSSIKIKAIRETTEYGGTRIELMSYLGNIEIRLQFDIGIGDIITPAPELKEFPVLLNGKAPCLQVYPMTSVIAEKAQIIISLGTITSRMKDFYDIWFLSQQFEHDFELLSREPCKIRCPRFLNGILMRNGSF